MRAQLERVVPGAEALVGTAESIPLDDDSVDAVFVAEAFHWFGTSAALDEIARVLRPGGTLAVLFNERDGELDPPLAQAFRDTLDELALKKPPEVTVSSGLWKAPFPGPFEPLKEERFPHTVERDREGLLASIASWSVVAGLPDDQRAVLLGRLAELIRKVGTSVRCEPSSTGRGFARRSLGNPAEAVRIGQRVRPQQVVQLPAASSPTA